MRDETDYSTANEDADHLINHARWQTRSAQRLRQLALPEDLPTDLFPGYTVVANVSSGGQGAIYEAIEHTTHRRVAIKVAKSGPFIGPSERIRFDREIRILGRLQHPNIVTIHTSGTTERHRYFVMDFIEGKSLDEFVQDEDLTVKETLALFLKIAGAIDAAHARGVTHRDLKPANIRIDAHGQPHVLDFGLAKSGDDREEGQRVTMTGQFVGSLQWAAPEQLQDDPDTVGLQTDVHGLGLVLYFMLARSLPYDRFGMTRELVNQILEGEHAPPSRYRNDIDDDLDTIVLKCLQVAPDRRYPIAGEVVRDIERYLAGQPIEAKRDNTGYLLLKTVRRHRTVALFVSAMCVLGVGYAATVSVLYERSVRSERVAQQRTAAAQNQYRLARESLEFLINDVLEQLDEIPGTSHAKRKLLRGAYDRLRPLASEHGDDPAFRIDLIHTHHQLGNLAVKLSNYGEAQRHFESEMRLREEQAGAEAGLPHDPSELAINHVVLGDLAQRRGDIESCVFHYRTALTIDEGLVNDEPGNARFRDNLGWSYDRLGALSFQRYENGPAQEYYRKRLAIAKTLAADEPDNTVRLQGLASAYGRLGELAARDRDWQLAAQNQERAITAVRRILALDPADHNAMDFQVRNLCTLSYYMMEVDPHSRTTGILSEAEELANSLVQRAPELPQSHWVHTKVHAETMVAAMKHGDVLLAAEHALEALGSLANFERLAPTDNEVIYIRSLAYRCLSRASSADGDDETAQEQFERTLSTLDLAFDAEIDSVKLRMLHLDLLQRWQRESSQTMTVEIKATVDRMTELPGGNQPRVSMCAGMAYASIGEHERAVQLLTHAKETTENSGHSFRADAALALERSKDEIANR